MLLYHATRQDQGGKQLVRTLCNVLWYIDGRHDTFSSRFCNIPDIFSQFQGFNRPELSKHRKREHANLSGVEFRDLSSELFAILLNPFWRRPSWSIFKVHVELLAKSLADYADHLAEKNKHMKNHHSACSSSRRQPFNFIHSSVSVTTFSVGHDKSGSSSVI